MEDTKTPPEEKPVKKAAPKKEVKPAEPLVDNGDGTVTDPNSG